jgi:hypothetical protein
MYLLSGAAAPPRLARPCKLWFVVCGLWVVGLAGNG